MNQRRWNEAFLNNRFIASGVARENEIWSPLSGQGERYDDEGERNPPSFHFGAGVCRMALLCRPRRCHALRIPTTQSRWVYEHRVSLRSVKISRQRCFFLRVLIYFSVCVWLHLPNCLYIYVRLCVCLCWCVDVC